jgi:hypothetical protein
MLLDRLAVDSVTALRSAGIRCLLLKGPAVATLLYDDVEQFRGYSDVDLLVPIADFDSAVAALDRLGYAPALKLSDRPLSMRHEVPLVGQFGVIDLHERILGMPPGDAESFEILWRDRSSLALFGSEVPVLGIVHRLVHLGLHVAARGAADTQACRDLALGLEQFAPARWQEAADAALRLHCLPALAAGLRVLPHGQQVAAELGLALGGQDAALLLHVAGAPVASLTFLEWQEAASFRERFRLLIRVAAPPQRLLDMTGSSLPYRTLLALHWRRLVRQALPAYRAYRAAARAATPSGDGGVSGGAG